MKKNLDKVTICLYIIFIIIIAYCLFSFSTIFLGSDKTINIILSVLRFSGLIVALFLIEPLCKLLTFLYYKNKEE